MSDERDHVWTEHPDYGWSYCRVCGIVRRRDGTSKPCRGPVKLRAMEKITPRSGDAGKGA